jgi:hypothetical protein
MIVDNDFIMSIRTNTGGYTKAQMYIVAHLLDETIEVDHVYPTNWKQRILGMDIPDVWVSRLILASKYRARDLVSKGVPECTGLTQDQADAICQTQRKRSDRAIRQAKKRKLKKHLSIAIKKSSNNNKQKC